jgi:hypothetical protein
MRGFAARHRSDARTLPDWVRTDMGGPDARLGIDESIPHLVSTFDAYEGRAGLHYRDYLGRVIPW